MANHVRQQIREYFGTTLTGLTTTGSNVSFHDFGTSKRHQLTWMKRCLPENLS